PGAADLNQRGFAGDTRAYRAVLVFHTVLLHAARRVVQVRRRHRHVGSGVDSVRAAVAGSQQGEVGALQGPDLQDCTGRLRRDFPAAGLSGHADAKRPRHDAGAPRHDRLLRVLPADAFLYQIRENQAGTGKGDKMMRRLFVAIILLLPMATIAAAELPYSFTPDLSNEASLQRGAKLYMNYCSGCHTLNHMRYSTIAKDLGIPEDIVQYNLMMTSDEIHSQIRGTMPDKSKEWFGTVPPDLTLTARLHGANWLYNFLLTFYVDETQENGVNNL